MFIHFEDWSYPLFLSQIDKKGIPRGDRFIKIFASAENPSLFVKREVCVLEVPGEPFSEQELYHYQDRESYTGPELELHLASLDLSDSGRCVARSLFRFAHEIGIIPNIMSVRHDEQWLLDHPFDEIDGLGRSGRLFTGPKELDIHIDIIHPSSLALLEKIINYHDKEILLNSRERRELRYRHLDTEGSLRRVERYKR